MYKRQGQLGPWALTAVGLTTQPKFLLMTMFMAMNVGATAMVARYKGAGNQKKADEVLRQALLMTFIPVSYTHLDVYKRQTRWICCWIIPMPVWMRS